MSIRYSLFKKPDGIYISVEKDNYLLFPPSLELIRTDLINKKIPFERETLEKAVSEANGEHIKLTGSLIGFDCKPILRIRVSQDKLKAYLIIAPFKNGESLTMADIQGVLQEQNILYGVKEEALSQALEKQNLYSEILVAEGTKPEEGENARLEFHFNPKGIELKPQELEDGSVDFYNLNLIQSVESGQILVEKIPATAGINGKNVYGEETKAKPGKDIRLPQGQNTQAVEEYTKLIATKSGHVVYSNGRVNVLNVYEVRGDVDFSTGNIKYMGNVIVRGTVKSNFSVEATGDVEIYGNLEGTVISESNIQVKKGIVRGTAYAKGNVVARYIENSQVISGDSITVAEAIMHSVCKAGRKITVSSKKGLLVGGSATAGEEIFAKAIGSNMGTSTVLEVGIRPESREEYKDVCRRLIASQENLDKNNNLIKSLNEMQQKQKGWNQQKEQLLMKARRLQYQLNQEVIQLSARKTELEELFEELQNARIIAENIVYGGVSVSMGKSVYNVTEDLKQVMFSLDGLDIKTNTYVWRNRGN